MPKLWRICFVGGAVLAEAPGFAQALSQDLIEVTNEWYKELSLAKTGESDSGSRGLQGLY